MIGWPSLCRGARAATVVATLGLCAVAPLRASTSEEGGSGLVNVEHAWSMPVSAFVLSTYGGTLSSEASPRGTRIFTFTPSVTKGLGGGFEAAAAVPFEGISQDLDDDAFDRRFDIRRRDITGKVRWTGSLGSPRLRFGVEGGIGLPLHGVSSMRASGTKSPDHAFDPSLTALFSANVGWFSFPMRVHANAGYWWSRDDGAVYYKTLPIAVPIEAKGIEDNDVITFGVAAEAGLRRFALFTELYTEQLTGARAQIRGRENLWRLTPGVRTDIGRNVSATLALSFDLSNDAGSTDFDPSEVFADTHLRVGLVLGNVLTRHAYEDSRRRPRTEWPLVTATQLDSMAAAGALDAPAAREAGASAQMVRPAVAATSSVAPGQGMASNVATPTPDAARELAYRVERLEAELRLRDLEARLGSLEGRAYGSRVPLPGTSDTAALAPAPPMTDEEVSVLRARVVSLEAELRALRSSPLGPTTGGDVASTTDAAASAGLSAAAALAARSGDVPAMRPTSSTAGAVAPVARPAPSEAASAFPLAPGEQRVIAGELPDDPLTDGAFRRILDGWAEALVRNGQVMIGVLVYAADRGDRAKALSETEARASVIREYLSVAGVDPSRVVAMGMGAVGESGERVAFERLR